VTTPDITGGVDATLMRGGKITGQVFAADTMQPLSGVQVAAYDGSDYQVQSDSTDFEGKYAPNAISGVDAILGVAPVLNHKVLLPIATQ
jgi:hypothetical protein